MSLKVKYLSVFCFRSLSKTLSIAAINREDKIKSSLKDYYHLTEQEVCCIYKYSLELFHNLLTLTDASELLTMDEKMISSFVLLLIDVISSGNFNPYDH